MCHIYLENAYLLIVGVCLSSKTMVFTVDWLIYLLNVATFTHDVGFDYTWYYITCLTLNIESFAATIIVSVIQ